MSSGCHCSQHGSFPASLAARWRSVWLWVLTASRLPWWPRGCKPHLPTTAKPAEGQAISQVKQYPPPSRAHQLQALRVVGQGGWEAHGTHSKSCRGQTRTRDLVLLWASSATWPQSTSAPRPPWPLPSSLVCKAPKGRKGKFPGLRECLCPLHVHTGPQNNCVCTRFSAPKTNTF